MDQEGVGDQEGRHAETGRVADAQVAFDRTVQGHEISGISAPGDMFDQVQGESPDHVDGEQFGPEWSCQLRPIGIAAAVAHAELAIAVDRGGAHQIANLAQNLGIRLATGGQGARGTEVTAYHKTGSTFPLEITVGKLGFGERSCFIGTLRDISERKEAEALILRQANYDTLTELPNRALFMDRLSSALSRAHRSNSKFGLLFVDLDGFKAINDTFTP